MPENLTKPNRPPILELDELTGLVEPGDSLAIGGHHLSRLPIAASLSLARGPVTGLRYFAWAGGLPLEFLLEADKIASIDLCFSSLDIFGPAPRFRQAAESGRIAVRDWPALALVQALRARAQNLPFLPLQLPSGSEVADRCPAIRPFPEVTGETHAPLAVANAAELDTLLIHAPWADELGNVGIRGPTALDRLYAAAARKVLVTVDQIVPPHKLRHAGATAVIPRQMVTAIARVDAGAHPSSCLPLYATDYRAVKDIVDTAPAMLGAAHRRAGKAPSRLRAAGQLSTAANLPTSLPARPAAGGPVTPDERMAVCLAKLLDDQSHASAGAVSPLANVAYRLAKATHAPNMILTGWTGGSIDIAGGPMTLSLLEGWDMESAVSHAGGDDTYLCYQRGDVTHEIVATAQVDALGRTNTLEIDRPNGKLRLPGQGGMADVANMHRDFIVYVTRHSPATLVASVDFCSAARGLHGEAVRRAAGYRPGRTILLTNLCMFEYQAAAGGLVVTGTMAGVSREEIAERTGFPVVFRRDCAELPEPAPELLQILRERIDPLGLRRLEFASARDRGPLLDSIIAADRALLDQLLAASTAKER